MADLNQGASIEADERAAFEAWASDPVRADKIPLDRWPANDGYKDQRTYLIYYGWKSGRAAPPIAAAGQLPPLPKPCPYVIEAGWGYTAEQYQQGQREAIALYQSKQAGQVGVKRGADE